MARAKRAPSAFDWARVRAEARKGCARCGLLFADAGPMGLSWIDRDGCVLHFPSCATPAEVRYVVDINPASLRAHVARGANAGAYVPPPKPEVPPHLKRPGRSALKGAC